jgi:hypothetical protein
VNFLENGKGVSESAFGDEDYASKECGVRARVLTRRALSEKLTELGPEVNLLCASGAGIATAILTQVQRPENSIDPFRACALIATKKFPRRCGSLNRSATADLAGQGTAAVAAMLGPEALYRYGACDHFGC